MHGVIALLDEPIRREVEALWEELERDFGVGDIRRRAPWPHVTLHGAERYDLARIHAAIGEIAASRNALPLRAEGLGIFAGPQPVLYVPVIRDAALNEIHARACEALAQASGELSPYYAPGHWIAHITLAQWDISSANLPAIIARLAERPILWDIESHELALVTGEGSGAGASYTLATRYPLHG